MAREKRRSDGMAGNGQATMKHAVYSGTRNLYPDIVPAVKSLIANSSVTDVWLLIEDDTFPYEMPDFVHFVNVSNQPWFPESCPNMKSQFTYMAMIRACYPEIFPDLEKVVQFDVDTICVDNVDYLWEVDLGECWLACAREYLGKYDPYKRGEYYNVGVAVMNLKQMRDDHAQARLVGLINAEKLWCVDQDAFNKLTVPAKMAEIPTRYNECFVTGYTEEPAIVHFAGVPDWQGNVKVPRREYIRKYREMPWEEVLRLHG